MHRERISKGTFIRFAVILSVLAFICGAVVGCSLSKKAEAQDAQSTSTDTIAGGESEKVDHFSSVDDDILELMKKTYSAEGIEIISVELSAGGGSSARITLSFSEHSKAQTALAGLRILRDNFPKVKTYIAEVGSAKYVCPCRELAYICSQGYGFECTEEDAKSFLDIAKNGIPDEVADEPIQAETI